MNGLDAEPLAARGGAPVMAEPARPPSRKAWPRWIWFVLAVPMLFLGGGVLLAAGVGSCLFLSSETRGLRDTIRRAMGVDCAKVVEVNARPMVLRLVRPGLAFLHLDPIAREAARALRGVEVGVYQLACAPGATHRAATLAEVDSSMAKRGWTRVVGVLDQDSLVAVYTPESGKSPNNIKLSVVVQEGKELVLVSARGDLEALAEVALARTAAQVGLAMKKVVEEEAADGGRGLTPFKTSWTFSNSVDLSKK